MTRAAFAAILLASLGCATGRPATDRAHAPETIAAPAAVRVDDLFRLGYLSELEPAADGRSAFAVWTMPDPTVDAFRGELVRLDLDGSGRKRTLFADRHERWSPRLSPDGRFLAWLESDGETVALRWAASGERGLGRPGTALELESGLEEFAWAPDGERFVVVRRDASRLADTAAAPIVVTRTLARRDGEGFLDDRRSHLWIVDRRAQRDRPPRQITFGAWDDGSPAWSPDGAWIAFVSNRAPDPDATDNTDLFLIRPEGGAAVAKVAGPGAESNPAWSHRGDRIAFHSLRRPDDYYQPPRVMTVALDDAPPVDLSGALDSWVAADAMHAGFGPAPPLWSADDRELTLLFERRGGSWIAALDSASGAVREISGGRFVHGLVRRLGDGDLLFTRTDPTHPPELHRLDAGAGEAVRLTRFYDDWLAARRLASPVQIVARNRAGDAIEAWLYPPLATPATGKAPLVVYIHGGPQGFDGDYFDFDLENQLFPAAGWGVLRVNYRGSTSYGEAFSRAVWGDWHAREYEDLMAALDRAIAEHSWIDPDRLGIGGWSYGGIMTLWTVGQTDRFRVGVPERFGFDYLSSFGEDQWFVWYLSELGSPLANEALYRRLSPATYLPNVKTPLYLISNENDYNCPLPQALQLYQRLKLVGQETELVVYPGASHSLSRPSHLADRLRRLLVWFGRHLDAAPPAETTR